MQERQQLTKQEDRNGNREENPPEPTEMPDFPYDVEWIKGHDGRWGWYMIDGEE